MKHRRRARFKALALGNFWLPCPNCGQMFGGHEWHDIDGHQSSIPLPSSAAPWSKGQGICPDCTRAGVGDRAWAIVDAANQRYYRARFLERLPAPSVPDPGVFR